MPYSNDLKKIRKRHREQPYGHGEREGEGEMYGKSNMETYITTCKIDSQWGTCCMAQETQTGALFQSRGVGWGGMGWDMGGRFKREGIYVYLWLTHVEV